MRDALLFQEPDRLQQSVIAQIERVIAGDRQRGKGGRTILATERRQQLRRRIEGLPHGPEARHAPRPRDRRLEVGKYEVMMVQVVKQALIEEVRPAVANPHDVTGQGDTECRTIFGHCRIGQSKNVFLRVEPVDDLRRRRELLAKQFPEIARCPDRRREADWPGFLDPVQLPCRQPALRRPGVGKALVVLPPCRRVPGEQRGSGRNKPPRARGASLVNRVTGVWLLHGPVS